jgi:type IV pilus assembly protein PilA
MLLQNIRARIGARLSGDSEAGFTLIELLVVMLILGILAAIALPAFFNQKDKAGDSKAKENAHTAQVAMETCATENNGQYTKCEETALEKIEPTIQAGTVGVAGGENGEGAVAAKEGIHISKHEASAYTIESVSSTGNIFKIESTAGKLKFPCVIPAGNNAGGCSEVSAGVFSWEKG